MLRPIAAELIKSFALAFLLATASNNPLLAEPFEGCPSKAILARFEDFGRTGKMPPDLGRWLGDQKAQYIEPWKAFDNVYFVGVCWVSAWVIRTSDGVVLIDTLHEPHVDQLIANLQKVGVDFADIKYVLMTHGHFDHVGGAAKLKPLLPNAKFAMTKTGWYEAMELARESEATPRRWSMIPQDVVVKDGDVIQLGGNTFDVLETPGHTLGTASYAFDVRDGASTLPRHHRRWIGSQCRQGFKTGRRLHCERRSDQPARQAAKPAGHGSSYDPSLFKRIDRGPRQAGGAQAGRTQPAGRSGRPAQTARRTARWRRAEARDRTQGRSMRLAEGHAVGGVGNSVDARGSLARG